MRILAVCGSPRKGNTEAMLREILRGAEQAGAETELILLRQLKLKRCCGCKFCKETGKCHVKDGMQALYPKLMNADLLVFGSPNYFDNVSGLFKDFMDRTVPLYYVGERLKGKFAILVGVGGSTFKEAISSMKSTCKIHGIEVIAEIGAVADTAEEVSGDKAKILECFEAGKRLTRFKGGR